jgi:hypothetical protein
MPPKNGLGTPRAVPVLAASREDRNRSHGADMPAPAGNRAS